MSYAENFVQFYESELGRRAFDREAQYIEEYVEAGDRVLDVGAGVGSLERRFDSYDVVGLDTSASMLETARERADAPFVRGDARRLPFATDSFDVTCAIATLEFVPDVDHALEEIRRVTTPGGWVVVEVMNTESEYVQANLELDGSYFQQMVHRDSPELASRIADPLEETTQEYFLGIGDDELFETDDSRQAAVLAVSGRVPR